MDPQQQPAPDQTPTPTSFDAPPQPAPATAVPAPAPTTEPQPSANVPFGGGQPYSPQPALLPQQSADPHRVRNGVLWIASGPILLFAVAFLQIITTFVLAGSDEVNAVALVLNIVTWLMGAVGFLLLFVGPIVGILILTRK